MRVTKVFLSNSTWTCPAGVKWVTVFGCGGGGGGGGGRTSTTPGAALAMGGAGGGGGYFGELNAPVTPGTTYNITIGTGGAGGAPANTQGTNGGTTSFDVVAIFPGGAGGSRGVQQNPLPATDHIALGGLPIVYPGLTPNFNSVVSAMTLGEPPNDHVELSRRIATNGGKGGSVLFYPNRQLLSNSGIAMPGESCIAKIGAATNGVYIGGSAGGPDNDPSIHPSITNANYIGAGGGGAGPGGNGGDGGTSSATPTAGSSAAANSGAGGGGGGAGDGVAGQDGGDGGSGFLILSWDE